MRVIIVVVGLTYCWWNWKAGHDNGNLSHTDFVDPSYAEAKGCQRQAYWRIDHLEELHSCSHMSSVPADTLQKEPEVSSHLSCEGEGDKPQVSSQPQLLIVLLLTVTEDWEQEGVCRCCPMSCPTATACLIEVSASCVCLWNVSRSSESGNLGPYHPKRKDGRGGSSHVKQNHQIYIWEGRPQCLMTSDTALHIVSNPETSA